MSKIAEISMDQFPLKSQMRSYCFGDKFCPAISQSVSGSYQIRIQTGASYNSQNQSVSYDYFRLDKTGLILSSPRGMAKQFNKRVRIIDLDLEIEREKKER